MGADGLLLAVLNTTPVVGGRTQDHLEGDVGLAWLAARGEACSAGERDSLIVVRDLLQQMVRGDTASGNVSRFLRGVAAVPVLEHGAVSWELQLPIGRGLAARMVLEWGELEQERPGRLRGCAAPKCERFLIDGSRSNQAKWCSMATCGNRAKARRHYQRTRIEI